MQTSGGELCPDLVSDAVLLKAEKTNKLSSNFSSSPFKVEIGRASCRERV